MLSGVDRTHVVNINIHFAFKNNIIPPALQHVDLMALRLQLLHNSIIFEVFFVFDILTNLQQQVTSHVTRHTPHATRHTSHVTRHTSHFTRHTSHVTRHTSHVTRHTSRVLTLRQVIDRSHAAATPAHQHLHIHQHDCVACDV